MVHSPVASPNTPMFDVNSHARSTVRTIRVYNKMYIYFMYSVFLYVILARVQPDALIPRNNTSSKAAASLCLGSGLSIASKRPPLYIRAHVVLRINR